MRTGARVAIALLLVALAAGIGYVAYQAGLDAGVASADGTEVVRLVGDRWRGGPGFFPGFLFFPLFFIGAILLLKFLFVPWGRGWRGPPSHRDWEARATDWHRHQHASDDDQSGSAGGRSPDDWPR